MFINYYNRQMLCINNINDYKDKGLTGLCNIGNTCFINSCLAILSHTYELNNFLDCNKFNRVLKKQTCDGILLKEWNELRKLIWNENSTIAPNKFVSIIHAVAKKKNMDIFTDYSQNDIMEFFVFLIDCFHTAISREIKMDITGTVENDTDKLATKCFEKIKAMYTKDYSEIWNMFSGIQVTQIKSLEDNKLLNAIPEPFFSISLSMPPNNKSPTLYDCFDLFVEEELLEKDNAWFNEDTKQKENVNKSTKFWSFPNILAIDFKRFTNNNIKKQIKISFPIDNLDLSKYVIGYQDSSYVYELYAVSNHHGNVLGGHYTAYIKNANGKWYLFNDTIVKEVKNVDEIVSPRAYGVFYRKVSTTGL